MKIEFNPIAQFQLNMIRDLDINGAGFIIGSMIGKYVIVENLFIVNFFKQNINSSYENIYSKIGDKLIGVFFCNKKMFFCDWFVEDLILQINNKKTDVFLYNFDKKLNFQISIGR